MASNRPGGVGVPPFDAVADIRKYSIIRDDFLTGGILTGVVGELGWVVTSVAGAADSDTEIVTTATVVAGHPGVIQLNSGPTTPAANDEGGLTLPGAVVLSTTPIYLAAIVQFPSVTAVEFNFGLFDLSMASQRDTDSICIELDKSVAGYFVGASTAGSAAVGADVSGTQVVAVIDKWYTLEIAASSGSAYFWVNGEKLGEITGVQTALPLYAGFKVVAEGAAEKSVLIDAFSLRSSRTVNA